MRAWAHRWPTTLIFVASGCAFGAWAPFVPLVAARLSLSEQRIGLALGAVAVGAGLSMAPAGWAVARWGSRWVSLGAGAMVAAALSLPLHAPDFAALLGVVTLLGIAYGALDVAMNTHAVALEQVRAAPVMSTMHGCFSLGVFTGASLSGVLLWLDISPPMSMAVAASVVGVLAAIAAPRLTLRAMPQDDSPQHTGRGRALALLGVMAALAMGLESGVENWSTVLIADRGLAAATGAAVFGVYAGSATLARFCGDTVAARVGRATLFRVSGVLATLGLVVGLSANALPVIMAGFAVGGIGTGNLVPVLFASAGALPGVVPAAGVARAAVVGYIGLLAAPPLIGFAAASVDLAIALQGVALIGLLCTIVSTRAVI